jgi:hypothetical protein
MAESEVPADDEQAIATKIGVVKAHSGEPVLSISY